MVLYSFIHLFPKNVNRQKKTRHLLPHRPGSRLTFEEETFISYLVLFCIYQQGPVLLAFYFNVVCNKRLLRLAVKDWH